MSVSTIGTLPTTTHPSRAFCWILRQKLSQSLAAMSSWGWAGPDPGQGLHQPHFSQAASSEAKKAGGGRGGRWPLVLLQGWKGVKLFSSPFSSSGKGQEEGEASPAGLGPARLKLTPWPLLPSHSQPHKALILRQPREERRLVADKVQLPPSSVSLPPSSNRACLSGLVALRRKEREKGEQPGTPSPSCPQESSFTRQRGGQETRSPPSSGEWHSRPWAVEDKQGSH